MNLQSPIIKQYAIISAAIIIMLGIEIFIPWPWSIMGGLVMIFMVPLIFKYTIMPSISAKINLVCVTCGSPSKGKSCPKCGGNAFRIA